MSAARYQVTTAGQPKRRSCFQVAKDWIYPPDKPMTPLSMVYLNARSAEEVELALLRRAVIDAHLVLEASDLPAHERLAQARQAMRLAYTAIPEAVKQGE